jgi:hypothetical protein
MLRYALLMLFACGAAAFGQQDRGALFDKAPAEVDRALRSRIDEFYRYHVNGETLNALDLVAKDTRQYFFDTAKPRFISFELERIKYDAGFTHATTTVQVERAVMLPGFDGEVMKMAVVDEWKIDNGVWCWWVDPAKRNLTPFSEKPATPGPMAGSKVHASSASIPPTIDAVYDLVRSDKNAVNIKPGASDAVLIGNGMTGPVTPVIVSKPDGVEASLSAKEIEPSGRITVTVKAGPGAQSGDLVVRIDPIGKLITIQVAVAR